MTRLRHPWVHLVARQLAAFTRLGSLGHLDLNVISVDQVLTRDTKSTRSHLLDRRTLAVSAGQGLVTLRVFSTFTGVGLSTEAVHGDRKSFVSFLRNGSVRHRARGKTLHNVRNRLDFINRDGWSITGAQVKESTQRHQTLRLVINLVRVFLEDVITTRTRGVLKAENSFWIKKVRFTLATPLILATDVECAVGWLDSTARMSY
ncbi:unannotated protein [freshwater metagenome]|uniref:Unannotated protein n=1 Tax=freshwater metagenome TaxID=449393 RepID=A0A6J6IQV2_9ZZZZ